MQCRPKEMDRPSESEASRYLDAFSDAEICAMTDEDYWRVCKGELQRSPAAPQLVPPGPRARSLDRQKKTTEEKTQKKGGRREVEKRYSPGMKPCGCAAPIPHGEITEQRGLRR